MLPPSPNEVSDAELSANRDSTMAFAAIANKSFRVAVRHPQQLTYG
jgi:hypothetical protein